MATRKQCWPTESWDSSLREKLGTSFRWGAHSSPPICHFVTQAEWAQELSVGLRFALGEPVLCLSLTFQRVLFLSQLPFMQLLSQSYKEREVSIMQLLLHRGRPLHRVTSLLDKTIRYLSVALSTRGDFCSLRPNCPKQLPMKANSSRRSLELFHPCFIDWKHTGSSAPCFWCHLLSAFFNGHS